MRNILFTVILMFSSLCAYAQTYELISSSNNKLLTINTNIEGKPFNTSISDNNKIVLYTSNAAVDWIISKAKNNGISTEIFANNVSKNEVCKIKFSKGSENTVVVDILYPWKDDWLTIGRIYF